MKKKESMLSKAGLVFLVLILLVGIGMAITTITDTGVTTPKVNEVCHVTSDIQTTLDSCGGNSTVYIPKGTYTVTTPITFYEGQSIIGDGPLATIISADGSFSGEAVIMPATPNSEQMYVRLQGFRLDANSKAKGILFNNTKLSIIEDVWVLEGTTANFHMEDNNFYTRLEKVRSSSNSDSGILIEDNEIVVSNARVGDAIGINVSKAYSTSGTANNIRIINSAIESGSTIGIYVDNATDVDIYNNRIENYPNCIYLSSKASNVRIYGGRRETCTITDVNSTDTSKYVLQDDEGIQLGDYVYAYGLIRGYGSIRADLNVTSAKTSNNWLDGWRGLTALTGSSFFFDGTDDGRWYFRNGTNGYLQLGPDEVRVYGGANFSVTDEMEMVSMAGGGNQFVCVDNTGYLYASGSACV